MTTATLSKWGNGQGLLIPKHVCEEVGISVGDRVELAVDETGALMIRPETTHFKRRKVVSMDDLFKNYSGDYKPSEIDWGEPVGKELW